MKLLKLLIIITDCLMASIVVTIGLTILSPPLAIIWILFNLWMYGAIIGLAWFYKKSEKNAEDGRKGELDDSSIHKNTQQD